MELSEADKKLLEASEEGKKILAGILAGNEDAAKSKTASEEAKAENDRLEGDNKKLLDSMLDPARLAEMAGDKKTPTGGPVEDGEPDFDNMDMPTLGRMLIKKMDDLRGGIINDVAAESKEFRKGLYQYLLNGQIDNLRRHHAASGSTKDFDKEVYPEMQTRGQANPQALASALYNESMEGFKSAQLSDEDEKRKAEEEQKVKEAELWSEQPGEATSKALAEGDIDETAEGVEEIARRIGASGNLEGID